MNFEEPRSLAELLREALNSVSISHRSGPIHPSAYRQMVRRYRSIYDPNLRFHVLIYDIEIQNASIAEAIAKLLRNELKEVISDDKIYPASFAILGGVAGAPMERVLRSLMHEAIVSGPEDAARSFYTSIARGYLIFQDYYLLSGIKVAKEVQVFEGISLIPLANSGADLPHYLPSTFNLSSIEFLSKTLLRVDVSVSPILREPPKADAPLLGLDDGFHIAVDSTEVEDFYPERFFQALTLVGEQPVQAAMTWRHLSDDEIFDLSMGTGSGYSYSSRTSAASTDFSEAQIGQAVDLYHKIVGLPQDVLNHLQIPIDRWMKSMMPDGYEDNMIDLGIAMESFFLSGLRERDQLSFRFRLRGSLYLGQTLEQRGMLIREFREIYGCRSSAVHEGKLPDDVSVNGENIPIREFIKRSQNLFKRTLLKVIDSGEWPDWTIIELGGEQKEDGNSAQPPLSS